MKHIFLSYSSKDNWIFQAIRAELELYGLPLWFYTQGIKAGNPWREKVSLAIKDSFCVVVICTPNAKNADYVLAEIEQATEQKKTIIPLLANGNRSNAIPDDIRKLQHIDFTKSYQDAIKRLIEQLDSEAKRASVNHKGQSVKLIPVRQGELLEQCTAYLESNSCERLTIYAPTGVWLDDIWKYKWFSTIALCLLNNEQLRIKPAERVNLRKKLLAERKKLGLSSQPPKTVLEHFTGIFGFPPFTRGGKEAQDYSEKWSRMKELFMHFNGINTAQLYALDIADVRELPVHESVVIDDSFVLLACSVDAPDSVDTGWMINVPNHLDIARSLRSCYDNYAKRTQQNNQIQVMNDDRGTVEANWERLRNHFAENSARFAEQGIKREGSSENIAHFLGEPEIISVIGRLNGQMTEHLRALIIGGVKSPPVWTEQIARRLKQLKDQGHDAAFTAVIGIDADNPPETFIKDMDDRLDKYSKEPFNVRDRVTPLVFDLRPPLGADYLIFDHTHLVILLPPPGKMPLKGALGNAIQRAIVIENLSTSPNQRNLIDDYIDWFDNRVSVVAKPYEDWKKR